MVSLTQMTPDQRSDEFDSLITYLNAVAQRLSQAELLDIADTLHELIRRRKAARRSRCDAAVGDHFACSS